MKGLDDAASLVCGGTECQFVNGTESPGYHPKSNTSFTTELLSVIYVISWFCITWPSFDKPKYDGNKDVNAFADGCMHFHCDWDKTLSWQAQASYSVDTQ